MISKKTRNFFLIDPKHCGHGKFVSMHLPAALVIAGSEATKQFCHLVPSNQRDCFVSLAITTGKFRSCPTNLRDSVNFTLNLAKMHSLAYSDGLYLADGEYPPSEREGC